MLAGDRAKREIANPDCNLTIAKFNKYTAKLITTIQSVLRTRHMKSENLMNSKMNKRRSFLGNSMAALGTLTVAGTAVRVAGAVEPPSFVIPAPEITSLKVAGESVDFPVRRVYCLGRNYKAHVEEIGGNTKTHKPLFFMKPRDAIVASGNKFPYPPGSESVHHEVELVIAIGKGGSHIEAATALEYVYGYAVGLDMTRRDLQIVAAKAGEPWEIGKSFDYSAPCSAIQPAEIIGHPKQGRIWLRVNDEMRQDSDISRLIWDTAKGVSTLSDYYRLEPGDLIFTGTPAGVGEVVRGDLVHAGIDRVGEISVTVT